VIGNNDQEPTMDTMTCILWSTVFDISELAPANEKELLSIADAVIAQDGDCASIDVEDVSGAQRTV
jgi:hypothetical protein